jgi:hypothetical protein
VIAVGVMELIESGGGAALTVKVTAFDVTPPDFTATETVAAVAMRFAGTDAVNCVALLKLVISAVVFHSTTAPEAKPVPFTVSVNAGPPADIVLGLRDVIAGPATTVKFTELELTPPEVTVTCAVPGLATWLAKTVAVSCVELTKTVPSGVPFHFTAAPFANPLPFTVIVKAALPAVIVLGLIEEIVGAATIVKVKLFEVTPLDNTLT